MAKHEFFDRDIEPKPVCANCDYTAPSQKGQLCLNTRSPKYCLLVWDDDACSRYWPDSKRWPDCDHD